MLKTIPYTPVNPTLSAPPQQSLGTTIIVMKYAGGVLLCADTRATMGPMVANRIISKICPITDKICTCIAGGVAHAQFLVKEVHRHMLNHQLDLGNTTASVKTAANILSLYNHTYRDFLRAAFILGGVDDTGFHCINVMIGGSVIESDYAISGSGGIYIQGLMRDLYRPDLTRAEAIALGHRLLSNSTHFDSMSGGVMRFTAIEREGVVEEGIRTY